MPAPSSSSIAAHGSIAIIGAGFSGIGLAIQLKRRGLDDFVIFESSDQIGGTWRDNTYPGCACDIPSHLYSYSFVPNPSWSRMYGQQEEIFDYLKYCVERYDLLPHIRFNTTIQDVRYHDDTDRWHFTTDQGKHFQSHLVVGATGPLNKPNYPDLPGRDKLTIPHFHSSRWDHNVDLSNKRIAVIGTGASAIQFVPQIAPQAKALYLFQRTPPWIIAKPDFAIPRWVKGLFQRLPFFQRFFRSLLYTRNELRGLGFTTFPKILDLAAKLGLKHIEQSIPDPALRAKVTPDFKFGCKRTLISNDYYPALTRPNVTLVTDPISHFEEQGLHTASGDNYPVDVVIYGTGFRVHDYIAPMVITGRDGLDLNDLWQEQGVETMHGITVSGFPNMFLMVGPNTGLGHNSIIFMAESQLNYILDAIKHIRKHRYQRFEVKASSQSEFQRYIERRSQGTVWLSGCDSWYLNDDRQNFSLWPTNTAAYWWRTRKVRLADYHTTA